MSSFLIRTASYPLLLSGKLVPVSVQLNQLTKFSKLQVGKVITTAKQRKGSQNALFPLSVAMSGLYPLKKVQADYLPPPKNSFDIRVNDSDYFDLVKEALDFDPSQIDMFNCDSLKLNEVEALSGSTAWILDEVEAKMNKVYQG